MLDEPSMSRSPDPKVTERFGRAVSLRGTDRTETVSLLRENADSGCTDSMVLLGAILADGDDGERRESVELFRKAHELGNDSGTRNLAYCYAIGLNVERDKTKGAELYTQAAEAGNPRAMCNIGVMYDHGNGVEQDFEKAFQWYLRSAEAGYPRGMTNLGEHYMQGKGTERDIDQAERWFIESGTPRATYRLAEIYLDIRGDEGKGMECLIRSAEGHYSRALLRYGRMIESERFDDAVRMYKEAASKGNRDAISRLEELDIEVPERRRKK